MRFTNSLLICLQYITLSPTCQEVLRIKFIFFGKILYFFPFFKKKRKFICHLSCFTDQMAFLCGSPLSLLLRHYKRVHYKRKTAIYTQNKFCGINRLARFTRSCLYRADIHPFKPISQLDRVDIYI